MIEFSISLCKTKAAYSVKPKKKIRLNLKKLNEKFKVISETQIVSIIKEKDIEIIVHVHGELTFKETRDENKIKKIAEEIYREAII